MKIDDILKLVNAGYSREEITAFCSEEPAPDDAPEPTPDDAPEPTPEPKPEPAQDTQSTSFDYDKFAGAIVKALQITNSKQNYGGAPSNNDISKFF